SYLDDRELTIDDELGEMNAFMQSLAATMERRKHAQRGTDTTLRNARHAQRATATALRKARAGHVTGGKTFGYTNIRVDGHVERQVDEREAAVVRTIFQAFADGQGLKKISA